MSPEFTPAWIAFAIASFAFIPLFTFWPRLTRWLRDARCSHDWKLEGTTVAKPAALTSFELRNPGFQRFANRMLFGSTTHVYRCLKCQQIQEVETIGEPKG